MRRCPWARLSQFGQISRWLDAERLAPGNSLVSRRSGFLAARRGAGPGDVGIADVPGGSAGLLRDAGVVPAGTAVSGPGAVEDLLGAYRDYLEGERGLVATTVARYVRIARSFCLTVPGGLDGVRAADVTAFLVAMSGQASSPSLSMTVTALASLLRYLHVTGVTAVPLAGGLPAVAARQGKPAGRPGWSRLVTRLLASCDRRRADGKQDMRSCCCLPVSACAWRGACAPDG